MKDGSPRGGTRWRKRSNGSLRGWPRSAPRDQYSGGGFQQGEREQCGLVLQSIKHFCVSILIPQQQQKKAFPSGLHGLGNRGSDTIHVSVVATITIVCQFDFERLFLLQVFRLDSAAESELSPVSSYISLLYPV